jgi:DNA-binding IclR family transcriptional regulator
MIAIDRYLNVLALFSEEKAMWTVQELATGLNIPTSTAYRTVRELARVNMLEPVIDGYYRLGAAFVEFDRRTRMTDPFVQLGMPMLPDLVQQAGVPCVAVLARLYGDTVMCVADARSQGASVQTSYERGCPRPLTRGATSKAILAQMPARRLNRLLPSKDSDFRNELSLIRRSGYCITRGEVDAGRVGIAVPVSVPQQGLVASLSIVLDAASLNDEVERRLVLLLVSLAAILKEQLSRGVVPASAPATHLQ